MPVGSKPGPPVVVSPPPGCGGDGFEGKLPISGRFSGLMLETIGGLAHGQAVRERWP
ncbi:MAG: hypothetical protein CM15mP103_02690 [Gammaproteobacteria bacterium]|nr:MAG: hypothetical protein CM15mP103_02690 [Gammaproteobacteria bacterium]